MPLKRDCRKTSRCANLIQNMWEYLGPFSKNSSCIQWASSCGREIKVKGCSDSLCQELGTDPGQKVECDPVIKSTRNPIKSAGAVLIVAFPSHVLALKLSSGMQYTHPHIHYDCLRFIISASAYYFCLPCNMYFRELSSLHGSMANCGKSVCLPQLSINHSSGALGFTE